MRRSVALAALVPLLLSAGLTACSQSSNAENSGRPTASASTPSKKSTKPDKTTKHPTAPKHTHKAHKRPVAGPALPQSCGEMIGTAALNRALGKKLPGKMIYIKGVPQRKIERTGRITCRYGVRGKTVPVEVGVSGYTTAQAAIDRIAVTIRSERLGGAVITTDRVAGHDATVMVGARSALMVTGDTRRTVAITVQKGIYRGAPDATLRAIGGTVMNNMP